MVLLYPGTSPSGNTYYPVVPPSSATDLPEEYIPSIDRHFIADTDYIRGDNDCLHDVITYTLPVSSVIPGAISSQSWDVTWESWGYTIHFFGDVHHLEQSQTRNGIPVLREWWDYRYMSGYNMLYQRYQSVFTSSGWTPPQPIGDPSPISPYYQVNGRQYMAFRSYGPSIIEDPVLPDIDETEIISYGSRLLDDAEGKCPPLSEPFRNACNSIGNNMNSIANVLEGVDFVQDLLSFKVTDLIKEMTNWSPKRIKNALSSGWLGYRYSYSTTKSDLEGMTDYLLSYIDPNNFQNLKRYAQESNEFGTTRCKVVFSSGDPINNTLRHLETTGLMLNAYSAWDMVPLSFVVDWFLPIGDFLEDLSSNWVSQPSVFTFTSITFSRKVRVMDQEHGYVCKRYHRWVSDNPPPFETYSRDPSTNTIVKRVFDGISLII